MKAPAKLGPSGRKLWQNLTDGIEYDARELEILAAACRQADDIALLEALLKANGPVVEGSRGQPRLSSVLTEVRQGRLALARLLGDLAIPEGDDELPSVTARSARARRAADARWRRVRRESA